MSKSTEGAWRVYRGVTVTVEGGNSPRFAAMVKGRRVIGGSYETLTKKIDASVDFTPFDALRVTRDGVERITVIGIESYSSGNEKAYVAEIGGERHPLRHYEELFPAEDLAQVEESVMIGRETDRLVEEMKDRRSEIHRKLRRITQADEFVRTGERIAKKEGEA